MTRHLVASLLFIAACAHDAPPQPSCPAAPAPACPACPPPAAAPIPTTAPEAKAPPSPATATATATEVPPAFRDALAAADKAIAASDWATADKKIAAAEASAGDDAHLLHLAARAKATRWVHAGDYDRAASAFLAVLPALAKHPELIDEFWVHNTMMMIREAQGDPAAALAENDQATLAAARGTWEPHGETRETLAFQKDRWHRAYLTRMLAESRSGSAKEALVRYAEAALAEYRTKGFPESIAILDAYFAALDGKKEAALAAAKKVDPAKDDDIEDLYLVVVGLEAGGDAKGADAVRRKMKRLGGVRIASAIMLRWIDLDTKPAGTKRFTPRFAR